MKRIILSAVAVGFSLFGTAQVTVTGISPVAIEGNYDFTWADGWGLTPDFNVPGTFVEDTLMLVEDGTPGLNPQGNPISQEGCSALINDLTGKIAVVYRNTCEFGTKALNAQNAGAVGVIIVNRDNEVIEMGGGVDGPNVTIPVVMLSSSDGGALITEMGNGPVVVFMGNKTGLYANDLGSSIGTALISKSYGVASQLAQNASEFNFDLGIRVYNYGTDPQPSITVNATIDGPSGNVYDETAGPFSLAGLSGLVIDSIDVAPGETYNFPNFALASYPNGRYTLTYTITEGSVADDYPNDNVVTSDFVVNDGIISFGQLDVTEDLPAPTNFYQPSGVTTSFTSCTHFRDPNASRLGIEGIYAAATTATGETLDGQEVTAIVYEWNDVFTDLNDANLAFNNLNQVGYGNYYYESDLQGERIYVELEDQILLADNQRYLFCVQTYNTSMFFGFDTETQYLWNEAYYLQPISIIENDGTWFASGFGTDVIVGLGAKVFNAAEIGVSELMNVDGTAYPNPATDKVTLSVDMTGDAELNITDISGRAVASHAVTFANGTSTVDVSGLESGVYVFNVTYSNGQTSQFNVVKK